MSAQEAKENNMAVQAITPHINHLRLVRNNDQSQVLASKIAFQANMERSLLNQKYWDELLEKLRKMGGGGGGRNDTRFDRIAVSMQLMSFLSNKTIQAIIENFNKEFLKLMNNISNHLQSTNQNVFVASLQKFGKAIFNGFANIISLIIRRNAPLTRLYDAIPQLLSFVGMLSFQLNKLKELMKKLDIKGKLKKIKNVILDFFVEMKEEVLNMVDSLLRIFKFHVT